MAPMTNDKLQRTSLLCCCGQFAVARQTHTKWRRGLLRQQPTIRRAVSTADDSALPAMMLIRNIAKHIRLRSRKILNFTEICWVYSPIRHQKHTDRQTQTHTHGWRPGSVVRTSVFGWRTFPDLRLIYGWHFYVTTSWMKCPLWVNQPGQLSFPSLQGQ